MIVRLLNLLRAYSGSVAARWRLAYRGEEYANQSSEPPDEGEAVRNTRALIAGYAGCMDTRAAELIEARAALNFAVCERTCELYRVIIPEVLTGFGIPQSEHAACIAAMVAQVKGHFKSLPLDPPQPDLALAMLSSLTDGLEDRVREEIAKQLHTPYVKGFGPLMRPPNAQN